MRLKWDAIKRLWPLGILVTVAVAIAAVPGFFTTVNATTGFLVNGSGGTSGYALCSDGTYYDVPCSVSGTGITALTGPVTAAGTGSVVSTITPTGVTAGSYLLANITVNAAGQITAASSGVPSTVQTNCLSVSCAGGSTYVSGTTYTNRLSIPVEEEVTMTVTGSCTGYAAIISSTIAGSAGPANGVYNDCAGQASVTYIVAAGATFITTAATASGSGGTPTISSWLEVQ